MKILYFDIETAPMLAHIWQPKVDWVPHGQLVHDTFMLCWAAKWEDGGTVMFDNLSVKEVLEQDDFRIVESLAELVRKADIIVAHNINRFDLPQLNTRLLLHGQEPLGPVRTIDTLTLAKKSFRLAYNKLDYLAGVLAIGNKIKTDFDLWLDVYHGDPDAMESMVEYNIKDVELLQEVLHKLKPYAVGLPRLVDAEEKDEMICPFCGSGDLMRRGFYRTQSNNFARLQCQECRRYSRIRQTDKATRLGVHPL